MFSSTVSNDVPLHVCPRGKSRHDVWFLCSETSLGPRSMFVIRSGSVQGWTCQLPSIAPASFSYFYSLLLRKDTRIYLLALCIALFKPTPAQENLTSSYFAAHTVQYRISCLVPSFAHWVCSSYRVIPETGRKPVTSFPEATGSQRVLEYLR